MNTTKSIVISSCHLDAWHCPSVELSNMTNAVVQSNLFTGVSSVLKVANGTTGALIDNNTFEDDGMVIVTHAHGCDISNNTLTGIQGSSASFRCAIRSGLVPFDPASDNLTIENNTISNYSFCIGLEFVANSSVIFNNLTDSHSAVMIESSPSVSVRENVIRRAYDGITFVCSANALAVGNSITGASRSAIRILESGHTTLDANVVDGGGLLIEATAPAYWNSHVVSASNLVNGLPLLFLLNVSDLVISSGVGQACFVSCSNVTLTGQTIQNATTAVAVAFSSRISIENMTLLDNDEFGIYALSSSDMRLSDTVVRDSVIGASFSTCTRVNVSCCTFSGMNESLEGVSIENSSNCSLYQCDVTSFRNTGILLAYSSDIVVDSSNSSFCGVGIDVNSQRCHVSRNLCTDNSVGIRMNAPSGNGNRIDNNSLVGNGFTLSPDSTSWIGQLIESSNTVNDKPLFYGQALNGITVPDGYGQIILANCDSVNVSGYALSDNSAGVLLYGTNGAHITNTNVDGNVNGNLTVIEWEWWLTMATGLIMEYRWDVGGVVLRQSSGNTVEYCELTKNSRGIYLPWGSQGNMIANCSMSANDYGLLLEQDSSLNRIVYCNISDSRYYGAMVYNSFRNEIHHNVFYHNNGAGDTYNSSICQAWNNGGDSHWNSTSGGNYWSDWTGPDDDHDGIVDLPYPIVMWDNFISTWDYQPLTNAPPEVIPEFSDASVVLVIAGLAGIVAKTSVVRRRIC